MNRLLFRVSTLLFALLIFGCKSTRNVLQQSENIKIFFEQDGKPIHAKNNTIWLKRKAFDVIVNLPKDNGLQVNVSKNDSISKLTLQGIIPEVFDDSNVFAIDLFNREKTLYLDHTSSMAWYYMSDEEHTFDKVDEKNGTRLCRLSLQRINDLTTPGEPIDFEAVEENLYLSFVGVDFSQGEPDDKFVFNGNYILRWKD